MTTTEGWRGAATPTAVAPVAASLAALHAGAAVAAAVAAGARPIAVVAAHGSAAALLAVAAAVTGWRRGPAVRTTLVAAGALAVSYAAMLIGLLLDASAVALVTTGGLLGVVLVAGAFLLVDRVWVGASCALGWAVWFAGALVAGVPRTTPASAVAMAAATALVIVLVRGRARLIAEAAEARESAAAITVRDPLTGLANRRGLAMLGGQIVETARRQGDAVHCVFLDLDGFAVVNAQLGRDAGDEVLVAVADVLRSATRSTDVVARWGGDEFCVIGPGPGTAPLELERRVRERLLAAPPVDGQVWDPRVSAGGSMLAPWDSGTLDTLLGKADQEMYLRRAVRREGSTTPRRRVPRSQ